MGLLLFDKEILLSYFSNVLFIMDDFFFLKITKKINIGLISYPMSSTHDFIMLNQVCY